MPNVYVPFLAPNCDLRFGHLSGRLFIILFVRNVGESSFFDAHSSTPIPVFLTSRDETQTMVREKLGPKPRPPQTLYLPGKGETQTMVRVSGEGKLRPWSEFGVFLG